MFRAPQRAYARIKAPNEAFGGRRALDILLGGELTDLMRVRGYLDVHWDGARVDLYRDSGSGEVFRIV